MWDVLTIMSLWMHNTHMSLSIDTVLQNWNSVYCELTLSISLFEKNMANTALSKLELRRFVLITEIITQYAGIEADDLKRERKCEKKN